MIDMSQCRSERHGRTSPSAVPYKLRSQVSLKAYIVVPQTLNTPHFAVSLLGRRTEGPRVVPTSPRTFAPSGTPPYLFKFSALPPLVTYQTRRFHARISLLGVTHVNLMVITNYRIFGRSRSAFNFGDSPQK